jgi:hypothetical protein
MNMKKKLIYLPTEYSKELVDAINTYFDKGYEIEDILNATDGYYIFLVLNGNNNDCSYVNKHKLSSGGDINLIEEDNIGNTKWVETRTTNVLPN